jgi:hypothetical protein
VIAGHGLFKRNSGLGEYEGRLYTALLMLAFGQPLSYQAYCQVEECLGRASEKPPHRHLLQAIERLGTDDVRVIAIVFGHLRDRHLLHRQFSSPLFDGPQLITLLAGEWQRPTHFRIMYEVTLEYLASDPDLYDRAAVLGELRQYGFLARALQDSGLQDQYQVQALHDLLSAVYPGGLNRNAVTTVLRAYPASPVTPALFAAALMTLSRPQDAQLVRDAYAVASLTGLTLDSATSNRLERVLPDLDQSSGGQARTRLNQLGTTRATGRTDLPGPSHL